MTQYIDKAAIVAEIEKQGTIQPQLSWFTDKLIQIINYSVEVKGVDLNEEIEKCLKKHSMLAVGKKDFTDIAKHFFELGIKAAQKGE